jgi:hypothetical protein
MPKKCPECDVSYSNKIDECFQCRVTLIFDHEGTRKELRNSLIGATILFLLAISHFLITGKTSNSVFCIVWGIVFLGSYFYSKKENRSLLKSERD